MRRKPSTGKALSLYVTLQSLVLLVSWAWFAALSSSAFLRYTVADAGWWLLVGAACAGFFGLRPNLERAIDAAWFGRDAADRGTPEQIKPIKRWIDVVVSFVIVVLVLVYVLLWYASAIYSSSSGHTQ